MSQDASRLDDAARAGWLYFIAGNTQEEIARKLNVSRQTAQRLVALAVSERLVTFRLAHPIARCMELAQRLAERHGLSHCAVVPSDSDAPAGTPPGLAQEAAAFLESRLRSRRPLIVGLGTGRAMRATVEQVARMDRPDHRLVSLAGNIAPDGSATPFDVLSRLSDLTGARHYPIPLPVFCTDEAEREHLVELEPIRKVHRLAAQADLVMVGIGQIGRSAPLYKDGFLGDEELLAVMRAGGVGEITSWVFDEEGRYLEGGTNLRTTSVAVAPRPERLVVGVAAGAEKIPALRAALRGRLINGLVTDESTAESLSN